MFKEQLTRSNTNQIRAEWQKREIIRKKEKSAIKNKKQKKVKDIKLQR